MKGSIRQRSKGSWEIRHDGPPDASGKRRYFSQTFRGNKERPNRGCGSSYPMWSREPM